ncbi:MAG: pyridoxamine 5'-phosphate oxidase family protein [Archangium sp.]|nr:pyridoxamine 5'-phosphate oxidase family protein [Archangium sp.]
MNNQTQTPETEANPTHGDILANDSERTNLRDLLKTFSFMMVATYDRKGKHPRLNVRPMYVAKVEDDCSVVFVTALPSEKVGEAAHQEEGNLVAQSVMRQVNMYGHFEISTDRERLAKVWSVPMNVWFPKGKDDPNACLMIFHPRDAELWDASGLKGLRFVLASAKAILTKTPPPETSVDQHATLKLQRA